MCQEEIIHIKLLLPISNNISNVIQMN